MTGGASLTVERLTVNLGRRPIVTDLTLPPVRGGEITAIIGPNGSGKSTVVKAIAQVVASTGNLAWGETDLRRLPSHDRAGLVGYMPQALPLATELTALESVMVALPRDGLPRAADHQAAEILEWLRISDLALSPLDRMSGGERQLVGLAQSIARAPRILLLDEPTSALDLARQMEVMHFLRGLADRGTAVLVVIHDLALAARWADRILVLSQGRMHSDGAPERVLTPDMLAEVYGVTAVIERVRGQIVVLGEPVVPEAADHHRTEGKDT